MKKVASINQRKAEHLRINLEEDVQSGLSSGLECYRFIHEALPEIDLRDTSLVSRIFNKNIHAPILISSMTGGTAAAYEINCRLAEAAQTCGIAMGVGSQRAALEDPSQAKSFTVVRKYAPDILLFANIGAIQLNNGYSIDQCRRAVDMIQADALVLHLNPLQEALQIDGNTNFAGLARKIESICKELAKPVIVKEVGWGISRGAATLLKDCGVAAIDVAGAGGTSWSQVEMHRSSNDLYRKLAASFIKWGIPTAESIINVKKASPGTTIIASGGIKDGVDIAKCIALGASLGGMASTFLKPAAISVENVLETIELTIKQIQVCMFSVGAMNVKDLQQHLVRTDEP